jgi:archaellum component FlaD/FlaE
MNIDFEPTKVGLKQVGLKQVTNFYYNVGYCSFDAITYLLRYSNSSINSRFFFGLF